VRGLRQMGSKRALKGAKAKELATICNGRNRSGAVADTVGV
jgi:hypothetical protein